LARGLHFVEIGGFDGEKYSNTLFLERERGWNGLLVEANPYTFQQMKRKDRACYMAHACVSSQAESMHFEIAGSITAAAEIITRQHATRLNNDVKVYGHLKQWEGSGSTEPVKCYRLEELMLGAVDLGQHIDFFSLDVEGAEMHILESISWDEVSIDAFMVEEEEGKTSHEAVNTLLQSKGFRQVAKLRWDTIYVANDIECTPQNATHEQVVCRTRKP
jgi:FkbM family methyltransferase